MILQRTTRGGFALPTVLIASVVMLMVFAFSVSSVITVRNALKQQYYEQLAKIAGEAGVSYAKACLAKSGNVPLWTDAKPLTPATDCSGNVVLSPTMSVLVVSGGGGGGGNTANLSARVGGGGGGGGGVYANESYPVVPTQYTVTVGAGGSGGTTGAGTNGTSSSLMNSSGGIMPSGGGGGGGVSNSNTLVAALPGGNGGGGAGMESSPGTPAQGAGSSTPLGYAGGAGSASGAAGNGGGGGGASGAGGAASGVASGEGVSGNGGPGILSSITGQEQYFGAGGSGGRLGAGQVGLPGRLGGGIGGNNNGGAGSGALPNTGAGGGGGAALGGKGGNGGSGVVLVRIIRPGAPGANITVSSVTGTHEIIDNGNYRTYKFTSGTATFTVSAATSGTCPTDARCSVTTEKNLRSSFSIKRPVMNAEGRAVAIPNTGYVELLRASTGAVWRTYRQPSVQAAVVPDFCSATTQSDLGWSYAKETTSQMAIPGQVGNGARSIAIQANGESLPGQVYYRKDFVVNQAGIYDLRVRLPANFVTGEFYINGNAITSSNGGERLWGNDSGVVIGTANLSPGCHTIMARVTSNWINGGQTNFTASLALQNAAPIVVTDSTWRVAAGAPVHYSDNDFYAVPAAWMQAVGYMQTLDESSFSRGGAEPDAIVSGWTTATGDTYARPLLGCAFRSDYGSGVYDNCVGQEGSSYLRANEDIVLSTETEIIVSGACHSACDLYANGVKLLSSSARTIRQQTISLPAGSYRLAARVDTESTTDGSKSFVLFSLKRKSDSAILMRSDYTWMINKSGDTNYQTFEDTYSYEKSFRPSPNMFPPTFDAVVIGGGGGGGSNAGGGGGGGGIVVARDLAGITSSYAVTIGGGGAGTPGSSTAYAGNGASTVFGSFTARGGAGGGSSNGVNSGTAAVGATGSGGAATGPVSRNGTNWLGWAGGNGASGYGGGGGSVAGRGFGAVGTIAGGGAAGYRIYTTSATVRGYGGGGGGGTPQGAGTGGAAVDGGARGTGGAAISAAANTGGGGGSSGGATNAGGNGGSGIVIIRYKTAMFTAAGVTATGGTKAVYGEYTFHTFTTNGTFTVTGP